MPAILLKQLRAIVALKCYDFVAQENIMKQEHRWKKVFNYFHGNNDLNIIPQIDLLLKGDGDYLRIYEEESVVITERNRSYVNKYGKVLVLRNIFSGSDDSRRFVSGKHFTSNTIASPVKSKPNDKASGRYIVDLAKITLRNLKKAGDIADQWLCDGELPSGTTWDDLYAHVLSHHELINSKEIIFTGYIAFVSLTKYNDGKKHILSVLGTPDKDDEGSSVSSRSVPRKKARVEKDSSCSAEVLKEKNIFDSCGVSIDTKMRVIEVAQLEDQKSRDDQNKTIQHLYLKRTSLIQERSQQIELAKIICPKYDINEEVWSVVAQLSEEIKNTKQDTERQEQTRTLLLEKKTSTTLVKNFIESVLKPSKLYA